MIKGLKRHNKKKAFTLVELMLLLVVLSLVIASSYSLITRKHRLVPRKSVHGNYACFMEPTVNEDTNEVTYNIRELEISGNTVLRDSADDPTPPEQCRFNFPRSASYVYMQIIGGGGAGGNANYKISDNTYKHNTYTRYINLIEDDWARREGVTPGSIYRKYKPKDSSSGENRISSITSWGGTTVVDSDEGYNNAYPRVSVTVTGSKTAAELPGGETYTPSDSHRKTHPKRGISRSYVDNHFTFNAYEKQVDTEQSILKKGSYLDVDINGNNSNRISLFDSNLFQYIVRNNVVESMFVYDYGGGGPTAPGYYITPLYHIDENNPREAFNCIPMGDEGPNKSLSECLIRSFNDELLGDKNNKTAARNEWCSLPIRPFANASEDKVDVCKSSGSCNSSYKLTSAEESYINNYSNMDTIMSSCPIMYHYYRRRTAPPAQCYGGTGGDGSIFTSVPVEFSYNFFPVLGIRWNRNQYLVTPDFNTLNCDPDSEEGQDNFMCYYNYSNYRCYIPQNNTPSTNPAVADAIDFSCYKTVADAQANALYKVRYTGTNNEITLQQGILTLGDLIGNYKGQLKSCSVSPANSDDCVSINGVWYDKVQGIGGTLVNAPAFTSEDNKPQLESYVKFEKNGQPEMKDWNYRVGGYPHGYATNDSQKGYGVGVGFVIERDFSFMNPHSTNDTYNRSVLTKPIATACIAPGLLAFNNEHQFGNGQTVANQQGALNERYPIFDGTYIPIPKYFGGYSIKDLNAPDPTTELTIDISTVTNLHTGYLRQLLNEHYYKWLSDLTHEDSTHSWLGCTTVNNPDNYKSCFENRTASNSNLKYLNEAFGMRNCDQGSGTNCYSKEVNGKHYNVADCVNVPLKAPEIPNSTTLYNTVDGNQVVNPNGPLSAQIPKSFGAPGTKPLTDENLQDVVVNGVVVHPYYVFNPDGSLYQCPGKQGLGANGNSGIDTTKTDRLVFVGRTGLLLKTSSVKSSVLSAPSGTSSANNSVTLNGEHEVGLQIKLHYYTHALSHGTPGQSGVYKTIFARAFTNSDVIIEPGDGGARLDINPGATGINNENNGKATVLRYNCDENNENCSSITAEGGRGGVSGKLDDETEYAHLHQTPEYIKKAIEKLNSIKANGFMDTIPAAGADGSIDTMSSPDTFNIFPHCSKAAPRYKKDQYDTEHENVAKYMINGKTVIDATCYGSGLVEADDSAFYDDAKLLNLSQITNDIDVTTVGKGGDGGFVRDDCWVVPQYFEIKGLFDMAIPSNDGLIYDKTYNGLNNKNPDNTAFNDARTTSWGVLPNYVGDEIYNYFNGDKYENSAEAEKMRLSGYTGIYPNKLYSHNGNNPTSCRNRHNRYYSGDYLDTAAGQSGYAVNGYTRVGYRAYGQTAATQATPGWRAQYATEIQGTEGQPGGVFISW